MIIENSSFHNKFNVFIDRYNAGNVLISYIQDYKFDLLLGIPNGGIPVSIPILDSKLIPEFNLLFIRKIQIPWNTEAGFGAITPDGQVFINNELVSYYQLDKSSIKKQAELAKEAIVKRQHLYNCDDILPKNKKILLIDDGIASGFSMIAGCHWLRQLGAKEIVIGVPTAPLSSLNRIENQNIVDLIVCLNIREIYPFAVADAYEHWYDISESETLSILGKIKNKLS
ncbi:MAG: phosphoribosyltransferase [Candidatus Thorarchaeota archaeon]